MGGAAIALLGVAVLVVAVLALRNPKQTGTAPGSDTGGPSGASGASTGPGASSGPTASTGPGASSGPTASTGASRSTGSTSGTGSVASPGSAGGSGSAASAGSSGSAAAARRPLVVLNDTGTANLAHDAARRFRRGGWAVTRTVEGYHNDIRSTVAYYDPAATGARAAARALRAQFPTIKRVVPRFAGLPAGPVVVVLTGDYTPG